ncbi:TetR/AcrR family transcriptional regulator [Nocardioides albidus]|uniref:TetR/AcrR family transcriptional regulator n=1 Tax=Nocardioides albidus TaxID=1517589 RepID=A0A5C4VPL8_9ACTN|nr:TetR/AcrR family transcriptional regulator [Nocardioides albidus]TNM37445.1 TetR/AcrR family transcriptional regulator [Nocardioides albidus]
MGRPRSHGHDTAEALLDAAERIAQAEGLPAVSVRRVADATGTSTRAVYSVFGSKDGLVVALATRGFELLAADVAAQPSTDDPMEDAVRAGAESFRRFATGHPALFRIAFRDGAVDPEVAAGFDRARRGALGQLVGLLDRACAHAGLATSGAEAAWAFHAMCEGLASLELRGSLGDDPAARWVACLRTVMRGLA